MFHSGYMKGQSYFSIALVILCFIAVKQIQKVGRDYYHYVELLAPELSGFYCLKSPEKVSFLPFEFREITGLTDHSTLLRFTRNTSAPNLGDPKK